ncbi:MAG: YebC/PmpR family DNA-binding transcriptional regulator [Myxococcota bacterium]|nr:YebC/PmpR family DNA-binding transcriptional regulator [Myxococcota bacterium]
MAGHSKWANIKRRKGAVDAARGKLFTKLVKEITIAARLGGGDIDGNPRLRAAVTAAKSNSMPAENISRAVKKGTGALDGPPVEEIIYEGYGSGGIAYLVECQTDNRNRTSAEVRAAFSKHGGNLGTSGSVAWMFKKAGQFALDGAKHTEEEIMEVAIEAGAEDVQVEGGSIMVTCEPTNFARVLDGLEAARVKIELAEFVMLPVNSICVPGDSIAKVLQLVDRLEGLDDVISVHGNFDIDEAEIEALMAS